MLLLPISAITHPLIFGRTGQGTVQYSTYTLLCNHTEVTIRQECALFSSFLPKGQPVRADMRIDDPALHFDSSLLLGDSFADQDYEPYLRCDAEAESIRSHPSSHADQALLPILTPPASSSSRRPQTQRLQRRRDHYSYMNGSLVPAATTTTTTTTRSTTSPRPANSSSHGSPHTRAKSYSAAGHTSSSSSWLLLGGAGGPFADAKRHSWTGERRETRKLQKDHPVGSARPSFTVEISNGDDDDGGGARNAAARGSVLGMRRKMERLRGLYRRGEKDLEVSSS